MVSPGGAEKRADKQGKEKSGVKSYSCIPCGYNYDPAQGDTEGEIEPGTAFEDLPDDWICPLCGVGKDMFEPMD